PGDGGRDGDDSDAVLPVDDVGVDDGLRVPGDADRAGAGGGGGERRDDGGDDPGGDGVGELLPGGVHGRGGRGDGEQQRQQPAGERAAGHGGGSGGPQRDQFHGESHPDPPVTFRREPHPRAVDPAVGRRPP